MDKLSRIQHLPLLAKAISSAFCQDLQDTAFNHENDRNMFQKLLSSQPVVESLTSEINNEVSTRVRTSRSVCLIFYNLALFKQTNTGSYHNKGSGRYPSHPCSQKSNRNCQGMSYVIRDELRPKATSSAHRKKIKRMLQKFCKHYSMFN